MSAPVLTERRDRVLLITLNRPEARNAVNLALAEGLSAALDELDADPQQLGVPEVKRSLVAAGGALLRLPQRLPATIAAEMALTGDPIGAERAHALGLVNRLAEPGRAVQVALELAAAIAVNGPLALTATKRILTEGRDWPQDEFFARQAAIVEPVLDSEDAQEGARAFAQRREPVWRGR